MSNIFVSFPGLGIDPFEISPVAFSIGKIEVRWYGIMIVTGIILAFLYTMWRGQRNEGIVPDDVMDVGIVTVVLGVLGARAYYVATTWDTDVYESFVDVIAIWNGGLGIYGGILMGALGIFITCAVKKIRCAKLLDMAAPGVMLAQAIGRWGNFFNGEAYGSLIGETSEVFLFGKTVTFASGEGTLFDTLKMGLVPNMESSYRMYYFHPTFLYECVWNLVGFVLINLFYKHKKRDGQVAIFYFAWYGLGRMFIEGLRTDSLLIPGTQLRISQCLGLLFFVVCTIALILTSVRRARPGFMTVKETPEAPLFAIDDRTEAEKEAHAEAKAEADDAFVAKLLARFADRRSEALKNKKDTPAASEADNEEETNDGTEN